MSKKTFDFIQEDIESIRSIIKAHHRYVDKQIETVKKQHADNVQRLNEATLSFEDRMSREVAKTNVKSNAEDACRDVALKFDSIREQLQSWIIEPTPEVFVNLLSGLKQFDMDVSTMELQMLSQTASGSYFASKILAGVAEKSGIRYPFEPIDRILRMIDTAETDCRICINAYCGDLKGNQGAGWVTDDLGRFQPHHRVLAADFLDRDTSSLTDLQDVLSVATDKSFSLVESEQEKIAKLFENVSPENRVDTMAKLIEDHKELSNRLAVYDAGTFQAAKALIRDRKEQEYQTCLAATQEASKKAAQAKAATLKAKL